MKVKYLDKQDISFYDGKILIYDKYIKHSNSHGDFDSLAKVLTGSHKIKLTDVLTNNIRLWYKKNGNDEVIVSENSLIDKVRLSQTKNKSFELIEKIII